MTAFYDGKYDVLISTTIVESGLDIPRANTLVVRRADMFGLASSTNCAAGSGARNCALTPISRRAEQTLSAGAEKRLKILSIAR